MARFFVIKRAWRTLANRAEAAVSRANIATKHEGGRAIRPAFEDVWAPRFLTNGVQVKALNQLQDMILIAGIAETNLQPVGFGLAWFRNVADDV